MTKREFKMPAAFTGASATVSEAKSKIAASANKVVARIDMGSEIAGAGLCPECRRPMELSNANGIPVLTCDVHRIALPCPNQEQGSSAEHIIPI